MPITMICPSCARTGKLPDTFRGGRVTCPGCGTVTVVPAGPSAAGPGPPAGAPAARPKPSPPKPQPTPSYLDDLDEGDDEPLVAPEPSRSAGQRGRNAPPQKSLVPLLLSVGGGVALLGALVIMVVFSNRGQDLPVAPAPAPEARAEEPDVEPPRAVAALAPVSAPATPPPVATASKSETIRRVKDATVYIKVIDGESRSSGTGFVIRSDGDALLIATNRHVISHHDDDEAPKPSKPGSAVPDPQIHVVFRSGEGPGQEQELSAQVIAKDSSGETNRDLAILAVKGVSRPPRPIPLSQAGVPSEGMEVRIYGFPFGQILNLGNKGNPAITVNTASVSSLRRDERGQLSLIQLDGSVQPGNSGGPIVDDQGQLIGVAVAKLKIADNFGLAIPSANLDAILNGWVGDFAIERLPDASGNVAFHASAELVDPIGKLRSVELLIAPLNGKPPATGEGNVAAQALPGATPFPLTISKAARTAEARITPALAGPPPMVLVQVRFTGGDGKIYLSSPRAYRLPTNPGKLVAVGERSDELESKLRKTLEKLGPLQDPDKDCQLSKDDNGVTISVPGKLHTLSPQITDKKNVAVKNSPMTLAPVEGDFLAHVLVTGDMRPGTDAVKHPKTGKALPLTFHGAGLVLWQDKDNYVRLERTCGTAGGPTLVTRLLVEVCKNGRESGRPFYIDVPEGPMSLMMIRKDGRIRCLFSNDGKSWKIMQELAAEFPEKVQVGLAATNISKKPFKAQFQEFALVEDKDKIAEEFRNQ